jgi:hypothetical protein
VIVVALAVAAVAPLREQAVTQWRLLPLPGTPGALLREGGPYVLADAAADFVEAHHPDDPDLLLGAGMLITYSLGFPGLPADTERGRRVRSLLSRAVEAGGGPAAWAAYTSALIGGVEFDRLGIEGTDPGDAEAMAEARERIADSDMPERVSAEDAQPVLAALRQWQSREPDDGMPVALEAWLLWGMHEDEHALFRWQEASRLPVISAHAVDWRREARRVLAETGFPEVEFAFSTLRMGGAPDSLHRPLREGARMAYHQGRLAQIRGEEAVAFNTWNATIALGRRMMESADSVGGFLVGSALQSIGASPVWCWMPDERTGLTGGPLLDGRVFYGRQHEAHARSVGERADAELRDSLAVAKVRAGLQREHTIFLFGDDWLMGMALALVVPQYAFGMVVTLALSLLLYALAHLWPGEKGGPIRRAEGLEVGGCLVWWELGVICAGGMLAVWGASAHSEAALAAAYVVWLVGTLFLAVLGARRHRRRRGPRLTWREKLRRGVPHTCALLAVMYLATITVTGIARSELLRDLSRSELTQVIEMAGEAWRDPSIPPDAWRAEYPPESASE